MKLFFWVLLCLVVFPNMFWAQKITVSEDFLLESGWEYELLGKYDEKILLTKYNDQSVHLLAYDDQMSKIWDRIHPFESKKIQIHNVIPLNNSIGILYNVLLKDSVVLKLRLINSSGALMDSISIIGLKGRQSLRKVNTELSENKKWLLIHYMEKDHNLQTIRLRTTQITDQRKTNFDVESEEFRNNYRKFLISNNGTGFLCLEKRPQVFSPEKSKFNFVIFRFSDEPPIVKEFTTGGMEILNFELGIDQKNDLLHIAAMYSKNENKANPTGILLGTIDPKSTEAPILSIKAFANWLQEIITEKLPKESLASFTEGLVCKSILPRADGGFIVLTERKSEITRVNSAYRGDPFRNNYSTDYFFEDILAMGFSSNHEMEWHKILIKKQYSYDDAGLYSSFGIFKTPEYIRLIYNDEIKNENTVSEYLLTGSGDFQRKILMNTDLQDLKLQLGSCLQVNTKEFVIPSVWKSELKLVRVIYP